MSIVNNFRSRACGGYWKKACLWQNLAEHIKFGYYSVHSSNKDPTCYVFLMKHLLTHNLQAGFKISRYRRSKSNIFKIGIIFRKISVIKLSLIKCYEISG